MSTEVPVEFDDFDPTMNKFTLLKEESVGELTIDCEETQFLNNNNCITFSNEKGERETYKATDGTNWLAFFIPGGIILSILIVWIVVKFL